MVPLPRDFYARGPTVVSRGIGWASLVRNHRKKLRLGGCGGEAYIGAGDPAGHAASGRTLRTPCFRTRQAIPRFYFILWQSFLLSPCLTDGEAARSAVRCAGLWTESHEMAEAAGGVANGADGKDDVRRGPRARAACPGFGITASATTKKTWTRSDSDMTIVDDSFVRGRTGPYARIGHHQGGAAPAALHHRRKQIRFKTVSPDHVGTPPRLSCRAELDKVGQTKRRRCAPWKPGAAVPRGLWRSKHKVAIHRRLAQEGCHRHQRWSGDLVD